MKVVPELDIETEVDLNTESIVLFVQKASKLSHMEVLVVVVMEDAVWLPRLPPESLEGDPRVVNDAVIVDVEEHHAVKC